MNYWPEFPAATAERSIAENAAEGTPVGDPVSATDANDDTLTYALGAAPFTIDDDGQIRVARGAALDYEAGTLYVVTVTATDPSNALAIIFVSITVTDVNEAAGGRGRRPFHVRRGHVGHRSTCSPTTSDPDEDDLTDSLGGTGHQRVGDGRDG